MLRFRVESELHLLTHLTHWPTEQSGYDPLVTHMLKFKSNVTWHVKFLIWNNAIDFFILGRIQNWSLAQTPWRWNLWPPHASKQLEIISWFHTNDISVHSSNPKFTHLPDANTACFLKNMWYPFNLVCRWDPVDPPKMTQVGHLTKLWLHIAKSLSNLTT